MSFTDDLLHRRQYNSPAVDASIDNNAFIIATLTYYKDKELDTSRTRQKPPWWHLG